MYGCIVDRIRGSLSSNFRTRDAREVAIEAFGSGKAGQRRLFQLQSAVQKTAWSRGVDQKPGTQMEWFLACVPTDYRTIVSSSRVSIRVPSK